MIYLHMAGSPSSWSCSSTSRTCRSCTCRTARSRFWREAVCVHQGVPKILAGQFSFKQYGESGQWISELLPHFASVADKACVIRTMQTDQFNHAPSQLYLHTGTPRLGNPSLGSWVTYGLGSPNENLPGLWCCCRAGRLRTLEVAVGLRLPAVCVSRRAVPHRGRPGAVSE